MADTAIGRHGNAATTPAVVFVYVERGHVTVHSLVLAVVTARLDHRSCKSPTAQACAAAVLLI